MPKRRAQATKEPPPKPAQASRTIEERLDLRHDPDRRAAAGADLLVTYRSPAAEQLDEANRRAQRYRSPAAEQLQSALPPSAEFVKARKALAEMFEAGEHYRRVEEARRALEAAEDEKILRRAAKLGKIDATAGTKSGRSRVVPLDLLRTHLADYPKVNLSVRARMLGHVLGLGQAVDRKTLRRALSELREQTNQPPQ